MKKLLICMAMLLCASGMYAQFEKNKWFVNPSLTGMDLSYNRDNKFHFGLDVTGGAFVADNLALLITAGGDYGKNQADISKIGVGGRYYFDSVGVYFGLGLKYRYFDYKNDNTDDDFGGGMEVGYAYFLSRTVTIEPAVYYDLSFNNTKKHSRLGLKIGFGLYF